MSLIKIFALFISVVLSITAHSNFNGVDLRTGKPVDINYENQIVVSYFLSSTCPCSQAHFDHLNQLQQNYPQYKFIAFHSNKLISKEKAMKYFSRFKIDFPVLDDGQLEYANKYGALKTPHVFVSDNTGNALYQGGATNSRDPKRATKFYLRDTLFALSHHEKIEVEKTKTLGCYIQR